MPVEHGKVVAGMPMKDEELRWDDAITAEQEERLVAATVAALRVLLEHPKVKDIRNPLQLTIQEHFTRLAFLDARGFFSAALLGFGRVRRAEPDERFVREFRLNAGDVRKAVKRLEA